MSDTPRDETAGDESLEGAAGPAAAPADEAPAPLGPLGRPPPADERLARALAAFDAGDLRIARQALATIPRDALAEPDRGTAAALDRALRMDPAAYAVAAIMFGVWVFLVARLLL